MRYIRRQSTNARGLVGKGVNYTVDDEVRLDSAKAVLVPKGSTAERPTYPTNGHLRYNTDTNAFEQYEADSWRGTRYAEPVRVGIKVIQNPAGKPAGWYIYFSEAPPVGKPVTVIHNFDK